MPNECHRFWSSRRPQIDHPCPTVSAEVLAVLHASSHAIGMPINSERFVPSAAADAELIPSDLGSVMATGPEHEFRQLWRQRRIVPIRTSPLAQFGVIVLIGRCGMVAYLFSSESLGWNEENGLRAIWVVCEIHLEITEAIPSPAKDYVRIQASAHGQSALSLLWRLTVVAPPV